MAIRDTIALAHQFLELGDPHMANYVLRDTPEVEAAGLRDLAWALHRDGAIHRNDVTGFIADLEAHLPQETL